MKWTYFIRQKLKVAVLLFSIMACSILIRILEDKNVKNISQALSSMYDDRLVPASDIFYMAEHLYAKKFLLHAFEHEVEWSQDVFLALERQLLPHSHAIDTLLLKYEQTYLVAQEKASLAGFKKRLADYRTQEKQLLTMDMQHVRLQIVPHVRQGKSALEAAINELSELEKLQTLVGKKLMTDAQFIMKGTRLFSTLQLILSIVIGIMVVVLVLESKSIIKNNQPFNLN